MFTAGWLSEHLREPVTFEIHSSVFAQHYVVSPLLCFGACKINSSALAFHTHGEHIHTHTQKQSRIRMITTMTLRRAVGLRTYYSFKLLHTTRRNNKPRHTRGMPARTDSLSAARRTRALSIAGVRLDAGLAGLKRSSVTVVDAHSKEWGLCGQRCVLPAPHWICVCTALHLFMCVCFVCVLRHHIAQRNGPGESPTKNLCASCMF